MLPSAARREIPGAVVSLPHRLVRLFLLNRLQVCCWCVYLWGKQNEMEKDIIKFLLGEDSFDGVWFGEKHPTEQGAFWWRKHLRQFINENQALRIHDVVGRSEQCNHVFQRVERGGEFQGNQCECGEWEDLT